MWPPAWWERVYEPLIRRAAGLGALAGVPAPDACEKAFAFCDLLVIGAGPAGLMAALVAGRAGARVILADEDFVPGGRLLAERIEVGGQDGADWAAAVWAELAAMPNVRLMPRTTVTGVYDGGTYGGARAGGRASGGGAGRPAARLLLADRRRGGRCSAAGAIERLVAFPGNDRPGVMLAGAVRAYAQPLGGGAAAGGGVHRLRRRLADGGGPGGGRGRGGGDRRRAGGRRRRRRGRGGCWRGRGRRRRAGAAALREIAVRRGGAVERIAVDCLAVPAAGTRRCS